jgi:autotransporter-associated beta strand protein
MQRVVVSSFRRTFSRKQQRRATHAATSWLAKAIAPLLAGACIAPALAQTLTWDASASNPTAPTDGSGNWNTTTGANWSNGAANAPWTSGGIAAIGNGGAGDTITIDDPSGTITAGGINFNPVASGSYTIGASGANTLTLTGPAAINVAAGATGNIAAPIAGSVGLNYGGTGTLNLTGNNTFTGTAAINSGTMILGAGASLGATSNALTLGTTNSGTGSSDPVAALTLNGSNTISTFRCATNNAAGVNTLTINGGAALNVNSNLAAGGLNGAFVVGFPAAGAVTTKLTVTGAGALNVNGGPNNSSFLVGVGSANSSTANMSPTLDMSGLSNFSFVTGTGPVNPTAGGNEFAVGHSTGANATAFLAQDNTITASVLTVGDNTVTPGLTGGGPNNPSNPSALNLGSGANVLHIGTMVVGNGRGTGSMQWATGVNTGSLLITGASGGTSTVNATIGACTAGTPASTASALSFNGHDVTFQGGTVIVGLLAGGTGGTSNTKGGRIDFDTGVFNVQNLQLGVATSGSSTGAISGTFTLGSSANSTGVLNVTSSFIIASDSIGTAPARGTLNVRGGTANIAANIIDNSTGAGATTTTTVALTGGTLNMSGFAIGPKVAAGNTGAVGTRNITTVSFPTLGNNAVLMNLGGTGINDAGLNMNGTGVLILEGNNNYTGGTTISSGVLQVGAASDVVAPANALQGPVTNSAMLGFGSSQPLTVANVISGSGGVIQSGSGTTTVTGLNSYAGATSFVGGLLNVGSLPNGGASGPLGASSNAATNLVLSGGKLQYSGAGESTDRLFTITPTGGGIDSSGSGAIVFGNGGAVVSADAPARATTTSTTSARVTLNNVYDLVVGMSVTGANIPAGTTIASINPAANSIVLSNTPTIAGADTLSFGIAPRTLTLSGTNTATNIIASVLGDSAGGGTLSLAKSGAGTWRLTGANTYSGVTTVDGGTLQLTSAAWNPVLSGNGGADVQRGRLVFDYSGGGADPAGTIQSALTSGYPGNFATGPIRSSTATMSNGLGWSDDTAAQRATVMYTYFGDANLDGTVDTLEFNSLAANFGGSGKVWNQADFNYDGVVDTLDFNNLAANFGKQISESSGGIGTLVPEPAALSLVGLSVLGLRRRPRAAR